MNFHFTHLLATRIRSLEKINDRGMVKVKDNEMIGRWSRWRMMKWLRGGEGEGWWNGWEVVKVKDDEMIERWWRTMMFSARRLLFLKDRHHNLSVQSLILLFFRDFYPTIPVSRQTKVLHRTRVEGKKVVLQKKRQRQWRHSNDVITP